jgi:hypothetical protein
MSAGIGAVSSLSSTFVEDVLDDGKLNFGSDKYGQSAAGGAIGGAAVSLAVSAYDYITWDRLSVPEKMCKVEDYVKNKGIQGKDGNLHNTGKLYFPDKNAVNYDIAPINKGKYGFYNGDYRQNGGVIIGDHSLNMTDLGLQSESIAYSSATHEAYHHFYPFRNEPYIRMMQLGNQN